MSPEEALILFLDFYKAFDCLEIPFLLRTLQIFGFGSNFCNTIEMLYNDINSSVALNNGSSTRFPIKRGIRQGCPISPLLFILSAELLAIYLKNLPTLKGIDILGREFKISQFADDTALFLKNREMVSVAIDSVKLFSKASGLTLNVNKCELISIHGNGPNNIASIPVKEEVKYLGLQITKNKQNRENLNISPRLKAVQKCLNHWLTRDLSILGRILLSKAEGMSRLIYPCQSIYASQNTIKSANSIIFNFIWRNKTHYLRKSQLVKDYPNGGLRAMEFESVIASFRVKWLKECITHPESIWYHIPNKLFERVGGVEFLLKCDFEVPKIPIKLSNFHKQALLFGKMLFTHNFSPHNSFLWNNRVITINRKSIFKLTGLLKEQLLFLFY